MQSRSHRVSAVRLPAVALTGNLPSLSRVSTIDLVERPILDRLVGREGLLSALLVLLISLLLLIR